MPYYPHELVEEVRKVDLLTYLETYEPKELVKVSGDTYTTKTHDSIRISNGMWNWFSRGIGGKSALDYLIKVKGYEFTQAVEAIVGSTPVLPTPRARPAKKEIKELLLPKANRYPNRAIDYLTKERGIDFEVVDYCIKNNLILESHKYHNVVFIGYDEANKPRYAAFRSTNGERIMGDCSGSSKKYSFRIANDNCNEVHLFECAIDLLSYATLLKMKGKNWLSYNLLSLSGVYQPKEKIEDSKVPVALERYLSANPNINKIYLHLDNDKAGRLATKALQTILPKHIKVIDKPVPQGKDVNDFLLIQRQKQLNFSKGISR